MHRGQDCRPEELCSCWGHRCEKRKNICSARLYTIPCRNYFTVMGSRCTNYCDTVNNIQRKKLAQTINLVLWFGKCNLWWTSRQEEFSHNSRWLMILIKPFDNTSGANLVYCHDCFPYERLCEWPQPYKKIFSRAVLLHFLPFGTVLRYVRNYQ